MSSKDDIMTREANGGYQSDEIDLVQLWLILLKRKFLIIGVLIIFLVVGGAFAYLRPEIYRYTTTIEIGKTLVQNSNGNGVVGQVIEPPDSVLAKLKESYIPLAASMLDAQGVDDVPKVEAKSPKKSNLILLVSKGRADQVETLRKLHDTVLVPLQKDHERIIDVPRRRYQLSADQAKIQLQNLEDPLFFEIEQKSLQIKLEAAKMTLSSLDDQKSLLVSQKQRLTETKQLLRKEIETVEASLEQVNKNRTQAVKEVRDEARAMTLLMISNQIDQNEKRLSSLRERLDINLENQKETLQQQIDKNRREWSLQKDKITKLISELDRLKIKSRRDIANQKNTVALIANKLNDLIETRSLGVAVRSLGPTSPRKSVVLALAGFLGLLCGIFWTFFAEFLAAVRRRTRNDDRAIEVCSPSTEVISEVEASFNS